MPIPFTLCKTAIDVENSIRTLKSANFLIVDCEGHELGCRSGSASLISIGTPQYTQVFVYDVVLLDRSTLAPVLHLLASPTIMKVVWDGRKDYSEIYHTYGTALTNTLDLQIVEVVTRSQRGEREANRLRRLRGYCVPNGKIGQYKGLTMVVGLNRCIGEHRLALGDGKDASIEEIHKQNKTHLWLKRPLSPKFISYAAKDIYLIHLVYDHFESEGYLHSKSDLLAQSQRYISIHAGLALKPLHDDYFHGSPVLPLDILEEPRGSMNECKGCQRNLSVRRFEQNGYSQRRMLCRVCYFVLMRNRMEGKGVKNLDGWTLVTA